MEILQLQGSEETRTSIPMEDGPWSLQDRPILGPYMIPNYEHRDTCPICDVPETMEHILLAYLAPERDRIWSKTHELWLQKEQSWPNLSMGMILGSCAPNLIRKGTKAQGVNRAFRILIPETAFLIWKMRCEHSIEIRRKLSLETRSMGNGNLASNKENTVLAK